MPWSLVKSAGPTDIVGSVPIETIEVTEAGPGGVSSMRFTCLDPTLARTFTRREKVTWTEPGGSIQFAGYVETLVSRPDLGTGRSFDVECTGVEALLDWLIGATTNVIAAGTNFPNAIRQIIVNKTGVLNATLDLVNRTGSAAAPIGTWINPGLGTTPFLTGGVNWTPPIATLRQQIEQLNEKSAYNLGGGAFQGFDALVTVDFNLGVRAWENDLPNSLQPSDYTTLTVVNTAAGAIIPDSLQATKDFAAAIDRVWVSGTGVTGFRPVAAGAFPRREVILNDAQIATANELAMAGDNFILSHGVEDRGEFDILDFAPARTVHAGSLLSLTDALTGATGTYRIGEIRKTYNKSGRENWHVNYGRLAPSFARLVPTTGVR